MNTRDFFEEPAVILLAEDDLGDQELFRRALESSQIPTRLVTVNDGEEALRYLHHQGKYADTKQYPMPDLMLLDLNMPRIDGRKVLQQVRQDPKLRALPIIVLTTSHQEEDIVGSYQSGVNSYITKPLSMGHLDRMIQTMERYWFEVVKLPPKGA